MEKKPKLKIYRLPRGKRAGSAFILIIVLMLVLSVLGVGMLTLASGARHRAIQFKSEAAAMLAAEAGYEKAVYWMSRQPDMLSALSANASGASGELTFAHANCNYEISVFTFLRHRPVYRIISNGYSGVFNRALDVYVVQAMSGWDMGMCRVPSGIYSTYAVNFTGGEIIDIPVHINNLHDNPDYRDIYITGGDPEFRQLVTMGEKRQADSGADKYASVIGFFEKGIYFSQPESRITDEEVIQIKTDRFKDTTKQRFIFEPVSSNSVTNNLAAVQLEFFVEGDVGKIRITDNCTVRGFKRDYTWDYRIKPGSDGQQYERYYIYAYHLMPEDAGAPGNRFVVPLTETYVTQSYGEYESEPGGQIYVKGNVIIGGDLTTHNGDQLIKGNVTVVASGNIWIADSILLAGPHDEDGKPSEDNENILGLIAQGVVRVVDPGMSDVDDGKPVEYADCNYVPIGRPDNPLAVQGEKDYHHRYLPDPTIVEAAITVGGGGWGAENVSRGTYGGRKEAGTQDGLVLRGILVEAMRGVVGLVGTDGYLKHYYFDERLLEGILPGDIWLRGKYVPAPAGWHDYRSGG